MVTFREQVVCPIVLHFPQSFTATVITHGSASATVGMGVKVILQHQSSDTTFRLHPPKDMGSGTTQQLDCRTLLEGSGR